MKEKKTGRALGMQWFTTGVSTTLVLILLGVVIFFMMFANRLSDSVKENFTVTVLMSIRADEADVAEFEAMFDLMPYTNKVEYISKEQALGEQIDAMGVDPSEFLGANPFSASFELKLNREYAVSDSIIKIVTELKQYKEIEDVIYQKDLVDKVNDNLRRIGYVLLTLAVLLSLVSFSLIRSTVRLSVYSSRYVIRAMELVGAEWSFIRRPFMLRSAILGLLSGLCADLFLLLGMTMLLHFDATLTEYIRPNMMVTVGLVIPFFGLLLTLYCTYFSVNKCLQMKTAELY